MSSKHSKNSAGGYASAKMPTPDGKSTRHRPRRNYWGNLFDEDTYQEEKSERQYYDYSNYDSEDDGSSYYDNDAYI